MFVHTYVVGIPSPETKDSDGIVKLPMTKWSEGYSSGYDLKVEDIPDNVEVIRFCSSGLLMAGKPEDWGIEG